MGLPEHEKRDTADTYFHSHPPASDGLSPELFKHQTGFVIKALQDEIVVNTANANGGPHPLSLVPDAADVAMEDATDVEDAGEQVEEGSPDTALPKRKRLSTLKDIGEQPVERAKRDVIRPSKLTPAQPSTTAHKHVLLGYWRDSTVPERENRHAVVGFIDTRDRLRTRIQHNDRFGEKVTPGHSFPPGSGGSWVTFERIVFERHLIGLDHNEVKEYVRLLTDPVLLSELMAGPSLPTEKDIVGQAIRRAAQNHVPDSLPAPQIAYGDDLPDYVVNASRPEKKRRTGSSSFQVPLAAAEPVYESMQYQPLPPPPPPPSSGTIVPIGSPSVASAIQQSALDLLPGTRPTKILLGFWRGSSEERIEDKHAVFGILGANDMFRVKVTRETRDGRSVFGNFPTGAGALWIQYDEVELEKHIRHLSRPEVKEYVRVRQRQIDEGETPDRTADNERRAVSEAQFRILSAGGGAQSSLGTAGRLDTISFAATTNTSHESNTSVELAQQSLTLHDGPPMRYEYSVGPDLRTPGHSTEAQEYTVSSLAAAAVAVAAAANTTVPYATRSSRHSLPDGVDLTTHQRPPTRSSSNEPSYSQDPSLNEPSCTQNLSLNGPSYSQNPSLNEPSYSQNPDRVEQTNSLARREVARIETIQMRNDQRAASRDHQALGTAGDSSCRGSTATSLEGGGPLVLANMSTNSHESNGAANTSMGSSSSRQAFSENIGRLNKVWAAQEATRLRADGEDAKIYMGVKYERKPTGPFQGKLVSPGTILSIDGEDYVEYRVLTKPTFF